MSHAKYSPSKSKEWLKCSLSPNVARFYPETTNPASEEGTRLHDVAETCLLSPGISVLPDSKADRELIVPYVWLVAKTLADAGPKGRLLVEEKVEIFGDDCYGKPDAAVIEPDRLTLFDLKTGTSPVPAKENTQLILYAIGILKKYPLHPDDPVELIIYQPRKKSGNPKDVWRTTAGEIMAWEPKFLRAIVRGNREDPPAVAGNHCYWCPHKLHCKEHMLMKGAK